MKDIKLEMPLSEGDVQSGKEEINQQELEDKSEHEPKIEKIREVRRIEEKIKIIKREAPLIEKDINKNDFLDYKNISGKDSIYKRINGNTKKYNKNNKRSIINKIINIYLIILMIFFNLIIPSNNKIEYKLSSITLKIKGTGYIIILYSPIFESLRPNQLLINGVQKTPEYRYNFEEIDNTVILIWNNPIDSCDHMFYGSSNIIEIDLSNFDSSKVTTMSCMFIYSSELTKLVLSNLNTKNVKDMNSMFLYCS